MNYLGLVGGDSPHLKCACPSHRQLALCFGKGATMEPKWIVYKTVNLVNGHYYYGVHKTKTPNKFDGYCGSSQILKKAIRKHGKKNFKRETLFVFDNKKAAYTKEAELVTEKEVQSNKCYNATTGGIGGAGYKITSEIREKLSKANLGRTLSEEHKGKISQSNKGRAVSEETRKKQRKRMATWWVTHKHPMKGKKRTPKERQRLHKTMVEFYKTPDGDALREKLAKIMSLPPEEEAKRKADVKAIEKSPGWGIKLARKWGISKSATYYFIRKRFPELDIDVFEEIKRERLEDIKNCDKSWGWKTRLGKKWGVTRNCAAEFVRKYAPEHDTPYKDLIVQRRQDVAESEQTWGWKTRLAEKWGVVLHSVRHFIENHAQDLVRDRDA